MTLSPDEVRTVGFIGAGNIGSALASLFLRTGRQVVLSNSRGPDTLADLVAELGPAARAATPAEAAEAGDVVVVTVPFKAYRVGARRAARRQGRDRHEQLLPAARRRSSRSSTTSRRRRASCCSAPARSVRSSRRSTRSPRRTSPSTAGPRDDEHRRALPIAGDDRDAKDVVTSLIDEIEYDVVDVGPLAEGWRFEPGPGRMPSR